MFCQNCGNKLEDDAKFCEVCGAKVEEVVQETPVPVKEKTMAAVFGNKNKWKKIISAVAVVAVVAVGTMVFVNGNYKKPINDMVSLINKEEDEFQKYIAVSQPKFIGNALEKGLKLTENVSDVSEKVEDWNENLTDLYVEMKDQFGSDVKVSYEILDKRDLTKKEMNQIRKNYREFRDELDPLKSDGYYYKNTIKPELNSSEWNAFEKVIRDALSSLDNLEVDKGYKVDIELSVSGKYDDWYRELSVNVIKVNGKWCVDVFSLQNLSFIFY